MKTLLLRLIILGTCILHTGCATGMLKFGAATTGRRVETHDKVVAAGIDVATAPIQVPIILALESQSLIGTRSTEQSAEEKEAVRESQQRERMRRITGH